jgi:hypothetical protein
MNYFFQSLFLPQALVTKLKGSAFIVYVYATAHIYIYLSLVLVRNTSTDVL